MIKISHILKANKNIEVPQRLLFFDVETYGLPRNENATEQHFKLAVLNYVKRTKSGVIKTDNWYTAYDDIDVLNYVLTRTFKGACLYIFSANLWFDIRTSNLYINLVKDGWETTCFFGKGLTLIIGMRKDKKSIKLLNVQNFYPFKVKTIGDYCNLPKLDIDFKKANDKELEVYCKRDVEIIREAMLKWLSFIQYHELGCFGKTLASQSFNAFRHRFLKRPIHIHNTQEVIDLERKSYYGGRVEAYQLGALPKNNYYLLDVNSMYPYVMSHYEYPTRLIAWKDNLNMNDLLTLLHDHCIIADVLIETDTPLYPLKRKGKTIFPIGSFRTALPSYSMHVAFANYHIRRVFKIAVYEKHSIFDGYVHFFFTLKNRAREGMNDVEYTLSKLFLNSLYGKFAQRADMIIEKEVLAKPVFERIPYVDVDTGKCYMDFSYGLKRELLELNAGEGFNSLVGISAHVTDDARHVLYGYLERAGLSNVYYCDTDSLIVNHEGYRRLSGYLNDYKLGALKLEYVSKDLTIHGVKDYVFGDKIVTKGIRPYAERLSDNTFRQDYFTGPFGDFRDNINGPYMVRKITKILKRKYEKGIVGQGGAITPLKFEYRGGNNVCLS